MVLDFFSRLPLDLFSGLCHGPFVEKSSLEPIRQCGQRLGFVPSIVGVAPQKGGN
jgi:hypothetical protein